MMYFAYGSNMSSKRLRARVPSARFVTLAVLQQHALRFHKVSVDGSAKCDAFYTGSQADRVIGVVYEIATQQQAALDAAEGRGRGYEIKSVELDATGIGNIEAFLYYATITDASLAPYHWYKQHVLAGAGEHGLPADYVERIRRVVSKQDSDACRHASELAIHDCSSR